MTVFHSKDNTPLPKVIKKDNACFFSRENTVYSNLGLFADQADLYLFSLASRPSEGIIVDQYAKSSKKYLQSFKLHYKNYSNWDIQTVFTMGNRLVLEFESNYASFKISR